MLPIVTMRLKRRYIICQALAQEESDPASGEEYNARDLQIAIKEKVENLFGDIGLGSFGTSSMITVFDIKTKIFVLRTPREAETNVRLALACITMVKAKSLILRTLGVAGCARSCIEKLRVTFNTQVLNSNVSDALKKERNLFYTNLLGNLDQHM